MWLVGRGGWERVAGRSGRMSLGRRCVKDGGVGAVVLTLECVGGGFCRFWWGRPRS